MWFCGGRVTNPDPPDDAASNYETLPTIKQGIVYRYDIWPTYVKCKAVYPVEVAKKCQITQFNRCCTFPASVIRRFMMSKWIREWAVLYSDSTIAWFKNSDGDSSPHLKYQISKSPETLAVASWTSQIPRRPTVPSWANPEHIIAVGSSSDPKKVIWVVARNRDDMKAWIRAITTTLPSPPYLEIEVDKNKTQGGPECPKICVREPTREELFGYENRVVPSPAVMTARGLVIILKEEIPPSGKVGKLLEWGQGWGWCSLSNGVYNGLTWSHRGNYFTLYAMPVIQYSSIFNFSHRSSASNLHLLNSDGEPCHVHSYGSPGFSEDVAGPSQMCYTMDVAITSANAIDYTTIDVCTTDVIDFGGVDCGDFMI